MLLECPAHADLRGDFSPLVAECQGIMARLVWDLWSADTSLPVLIKCHADDEQTLLRPFSLVGIRPAGCVGITLRFLALHVGVTTSA